MAWGIEYCPYCKASKRIDTDLVEYDGDQIARVCKKSECWEKQREEKEKFAEYNLNKTKEEGWELIQEAMNKWCKITVNFESYVWLTEQQKELCRLHNQKCQKIEDSEKQKENLLKCQKCQQIPKDSKYYEVGGEGRYCKSCAEEVVDKNGRETEKPTNNSPTTNSLNNTKEPCDECSLTSSSNGKFYTVYGKGNYCNDCADKLLKKDNSLSDNDSSGKGKNLPQPNKGKKNIKMLVDDKIWENLKRMVKSGEKSADEVINEYDLSSDQREELWNYEFNNELGQPKPFYRQPWVIIGTVIILLIPLILIVKNTKSKKKRK